MQYHRGYTETLPEIGWIFIFVGWFGVFCYIMKYFGMLRGIMGEDELSRKHENSKIIGWKNILIMSGGGKRRWLSIEN